MQSSLSVDLRERVVAAVTVGASFYLAALLGASVSSASRWSEWFAKKGHVAPKPTHWDDSTPVIEAHADLILSACEARSLIFLHELRDTLAEQRVQTSTSSLSQFFARHGINCKKARCTPPSRSGQI